MKNILRTAVQQRRQYLIDKLLKIGVFKKEDRHLYEWTLSDLEKEYKHIESITIKGNLEQENQQLQ
ncbi:Fur-regulated basic protein FbpA [Neobacillus sp. CF12]|jgi:Fur-regulated basic protein A|uniref:Fur-regulated basic protein FbpA n=1 Tax=Neobacillus sp. CF12 TaxID=3055864 RepID=UPI0025A2624E|nr:Fur-regulated basic protein FbpA [Neobacillus sp. CF12]MDM5327174.1 Fur-regulated basic protein FbpA [Neobacillus sp. CF12]